VLLMKVVVAPFAPVPRSDVAVVVAALAQVAVADGDVVRQAAAVKRWV
jgi:hypothetical protein